MRQTVLYMVALAACWGALFLLHQGRSPEPTLTGLPDGAKVTRIDSHQVLVQLTDGRSTVANLPVQEQSWRTNVPVGDWCWWVAALVVMFILGGFHVVDQCARRPIGRWGKLVGFLEPGVSWRNPLLYDGLRCDINVQEYVQVIEVEDAQTHDNVPIKFSVAITLCVDADRLTDYVVNVWKATDAMKNRALAVIGRGVGETELADILHNRHDLHESSLRQLRQSCSRWGLNISGLEVRDVSITDESIQSAIAMAARAEKEAQGELVRARKQVEINGHLNEAANIMGPDAWKLKGIETLLELCRSAENNTVIIPSDVIQALGSIVGART